MSVLADRVSATLAQLQLAGTYKELRFLTSPMGPVATIEGVGDVLVFCSNNYLGLANHPEVVDAGKKGLETYGAGTASVRFICGTFDCHRDLENRIASFLGTESALSYVSCWNANEGLLTNIVEKGDVIFSDALNHASIIDATRLARQADRKVYPHNDLSTLSHLLTEYQASPVKVVVTDGVFSMEGDVADLDGLLEICRQHQATLVIDDSHGVGVLGKTGMGLHEHCGLVEKGYDGVDVIFTGTLGKALGGAAGGYVAGPRWLTELLVQRSRPQLFSNALPATVACSANKALEILQREPQRVAKLQNNVAYLRDGLTKLGFKVLESPTAILPIIVGDTALAIRLSNRLLEKGVFVIGFGFPVVPEGEARLRVQMSAAHEPEHLDRALAAFEELKREEKLSF